MVNVRPGNVVDDIARELRERIIEGLYAPGVRLSQQGVADELNVSRTPLREALKQLEAEGLVVGTANRGFEVAPARHDDVEQSYAVRLLVEPPLVAALVDRVAEEDIAAMAEALADMERAGLRIRDFQEAHFRFHDVLLRRYPPMIAQMTAQQHSRIYRHQRLYLSRPAIPADFANVDRAFLDAVRDRDDEKARQLLELHLIDAVLGIVLDASPDHRFDALLTTLRGLGLELTHDPDGRIVRPADLNWRRPNAVVVGDTATSNLCYRASRSDPR
ncbi:GntR family transcriptional regulator [Uniformispora flossi]|uniref:GntR family transcriptional regulator n=1 Tax=Uniformispora flossi TaxID=3390723 RepID=UPI003C2F9A8D